eukprot:6290-Heterococcus_DN1.PRE.5
MRIEHLWYSGNSSMLASEHTSWSPELESCSASGLLWTQMCMLMSISYSMHLTSELVGALHLPIGRQPLHTSDALVQIQARQRTLCTHRSA